VIIDIPEPRTIVIRGHVIHHNNCTYCVFREVSRFKVGRKKREIERCERTGKNLVRPNAPPDEGQRYCEHYVQKGCECDACKNPGKSIDKSE
jgi:hypothetical protein